MKIVFVALLSWFLVDTQGAQAWPAPPIGAFCAPGAWYDGSNCQFGIPASGTAFIHQNAFYTSKVGASCPPGTTWDTANCYFREVPSGFDPFIHQNYWYTKTNPHFTYRSSTCPPDTTYDGANCFRGQPPSGKTAKVKYGYFGFERSLYANCSNMMNGASGGLDPFFCKVHAVPANHEAFVYQNKWYTEPTPNRPGAWWVKTYLNDPDERRKPVCTPDTSNRTWVLDWSEEFDDQPDNKVCYTSSSEALQCVYREWWGFGKCTDAPTNWRTSVRPHWSTLQVQKYGGLANLNKCRWKVYDQYNQWDFSLPAAERSNSYSPENITISGGLLRLKTQLHAKPASGWDCGRQLEPNPGQNGNLRSKVCPHSGASLDTATGLPWTASNNPNAANADQRFVGAVAGYGRVEFRARINAIGHGAWPALWLWGEDNPGPGGQGELDALEYLADLGGRPDQIVKGSATHGKAMQTMHNWGIDSQGYPHTSDAVGIPISIGEWHTYAVEYEPTEIRMYIDGCLRNRVREGDLIYVQPWDRPNDQAGNAYRPFRIPTDRKYHLLIGNAASAASWLPSWYRAYGGGTLERKDFKPTTFDVDYVRVYKRP
jgi:hypothetical protein